MSPMPRNFSALRSWGIVASDTVMLSPDPAVSSMFPKQSIAAMIQQVELLGSGQATRFDGVHHEMWTSSILST